MHPETFAADRRERLRVADEALRPVVSDALDRFVGGQKGTWANDLVEAAVQVWVENFQAEAPGARRDAAELRFRRRLALGLRKTTDYGDVSEGQVDRITRWISTYATNAGTVQGSNAAGRSGKRWVTMGDDAVRESHEPLDGQVRPVGGTFDVAGYRLAYPGEPVGPPEIWINCRCVAMPAAREGEAMSDATYVLGQDDKLEDDNPDVVLSNNAFSAVITDDDVRTGAVVEWVGENGTTYYGPFDTAENAQRWIESDNAPWDGEASVIETTRVPQDAEVIEPPDEESVAEDAPEDDEEDVTEIPIHGVAAPEGVATGDGRMFALGALTHRDLPLPLLYQPVSVPGHDQAYTIGRIDEIYRVEGENLVRYRGAIVLGRDYAGQVIQGIIDGTERGVSVDVDDVELDMSRELELMERMEAGDEDAKAEYLGLDGKMPMTTFKQARISGLTIVSIPAFQEAYIALGRDDDEGVVASAALQACGCIQAGIELDDVVDLTSDVVVVERTDENGTAVFGPFDTRAEAEEWMATAGDGEYDIVPVNKGVMASATFAPGTHDGPGWITNPGATARIRRYWVRGKGAAKIKWGAPGDFNRCRAQLAKYVQNPDWLAGLCANMHKEALGIWPAQHGADKKLAVTASATRAPAIILASGAKVYDRALFAEPPVDLEMPVNIDRKTRRIYGYLAEWGVCHVGIEGLCTTPDPSENDYAYFRKGIVETTEGVLRIGNLSMGQGHADIRWRNAVATAHYDKPDAVKAYVNIGDNARGIWYSGVLVPWATDAEIDKMLAIGAFSGDWRDWGNRELDLIAATCVNTPGYQIRPAMAASGGRQISLTGAGVPVRRHALIASASMRMDPDEVAAIARTAVAEYRHQEKVSEKVGPARARAKSARLARARNRQS